MTPSPHRRAAHFRRLAAATVALALGMTWFVPGAPTADAAGTHPTYANACAQTPHGFARCFAEYRRSGGVAPQAIRPNTLPPGFGAGELQDAYNLPAAGGVGRVISIVDAFDLPDAESELA